MTYKKSLLMEELVGRILMEQILMDKRKKGQTMTNLRGSVCGKRRREKCTQPIGGERSQGKDVYVLVVLERD